MLYTYINAFINLGLWSCLEMKDCKKKVLIAWSTRFIDCLPTWSCWHQCMIYILPVYVYIQKYVKFYRLYSAPDYFLNTVSFHSQCLWEKQKWSTLEVLFLKKYMIVVWAQTAFKGPEQAERGIHMKAFLNCMLKETNKTKPQHPGHFVYLVAVLRCEWNRNLFNGGERSLKSTAVWC